MSDERHVFLDVDTQVDFMLPEGSLYVPGAEARIPDMRRLMEYASDKGLLVVSSTDAHAIDDASFDRWPPHCVVGSAGQEKIPETQLPAPLVIPNRPMPYQLRLPAHGQVILEKTDYDVTSNPNFDAVAAALGPSRFVVFGVATEYCVRNSALALRQRGFAVDLVTDAIQAITAEGGRKAIEEMEAKGVRLVSTASVLENAGATGGRAA